MKKLLIILLFVSSLFAQNGVAPMPQSKPKFFTRSGNVCSGCKLYSFVTGTGTPLQTYTDSSGTVQNLNPITMGSDGMPPQEIWLGAFSYDLTLKDSSGAVIYTVKNISVPNIQALTQISLTVTGPVTIASSTPGIASSSSTLEWDALYSNGTSIATDRFQCSNIPVSFISANPATVLTCVHSGSSGGGSMSTNFAISTPQLNKIFFVDGTKYPVTQAGVQQAFTDACAVSSGPAPGTDVYIPPAVILLSNSVGQQFLVTCNLHIHGAGDYSTMFDVVTGVSSAIPIFRIKPDHVSAQSDFQIEGVQITSDAANGGTALLFDGTNPGMSGPNNFVVRKNFIHGLAPGSWSIDTLGNATPGLSQMGWNLIENNSLNSGVHLGTPAVDSWLFLHNIFGSDIGGTTPCVDGTTANNGASHITLLANNGGCNGGFFISHGTHECKILYNQIEIPNAGTGSVNSAAIDLIGDTFSIDQCEIRGNNLGQGGATIGVRAGVATGTIIVGNTIGVKPTTGVGVALTASSSATTMDSTNAFPGVGGGAVAMTNATGVNPFDIPLPKTDGTLPAHIRNATEGGVLVCSNGGACWTIVNGGVLFSPPGQPIALNGTNSGVVEILVPDNGGTAFVRPPDVDSVTSIKLQVASDFTLAANTSLQTITGLTTTLAANARNFSFHCALSYSQSTAAVSDAFGIQVATNTPTNVVATGQVYTAATVSTTATLATLSTSTATNIVAFTPSATATNFTAMLDGTIELPATTHTINFMASQSNAADLVTIKRGSYCQVF